VTELLTALLIWTAQATGYPAVEPAPKVELASAEDLGAIFAAGGADAGGRQVAALYEPARNVISIDESLDLEGPLGRSYLVHELVHALQFAAGRQAEVRCVGLLEAEAYRVQALYLKDHDRQQEANLHTILGLMQAGCAWPE
jgi:hypothetical protein